VDGRDVWESGVAVVVVVGRLRLRRGKGELIEEDVALCCCDRLA